MASAIAVGDGAIFPRDLSALPRHRRLWRRLPVGVGGGAGGVSQERSLPLDRRGVRGRGYADFRTRRGRADRRQPRSRRRDVVVRLLEGVFFFTDDERRLLAKLDALHRPPLVVVV